MIGGSRLQRGHVSRVALAVMAAWVLLAVLFPHALPAQQDERSVRAAFVYNLTKYVAWPISEHEVNICVIGEGATGPALKHVVDGKISDGRTIHVLLEPSDDGLRHCDIVYLTEGTAARLHSILDKTRRALILTVGEDDRFVREGGMIGFVRTGDSIQIEVNIDSVKAGDLKISSRLLDLALIVHTEKRG